MLRTLQYYDVIDAYVEMKIDHTLFMVGSRKQYKLDQFFTEGREIADTLDKAYGFDSDVELEQQIVLLSAIFRTKRIKDHVLFPEYVDRLLEKRGLSRKSGSTILDVLGQ